MLSWLYRKVVPQPALDAEPDKTGAGWGMDHLIDMLHTNTERPGLGDVVAKLESCSMGVSVRRDTRYRVIELGPYDTSVVGMTTDLDTDILHCHYMRKHKTIPRWWWLFD